MSTYLQVVSMSIHYSPERSMHYIFNKWIDPTITNLHDNNYKERVVFVTDLLYWLRPIGLKPRSIPQTSVADLRTLVSDLSWLIYFWYWSLCTWDFFPQHVTAEWLERGSDASWRSLAKPEISPDSRTYCTVLAAIACRQSQSQDWGRRCQWDMWSGRRSIHEQQQETGVLQGHLAHRL